jgi:hypothetical protein
MAAEVVQQLLAAGLSRFEPDPLRALAEVEAQCARHAIDQPSIERGLT